MIAPMTSIKVSEYQGPTCSVCKHNYLVTTIHKLNIQNTAVDHGDKKERKSYEDLLALIF